jgi:hypothetical protein
MKICRDVEEWITENVEQVFARQEKRCKKWPWPLNLLCSLVTFLVKVIVTVVKKIMRVVCEVVMVTVTIVAAVINAILAIPIFGASIRAITRAITAVVSYVVGLLDGVGRAVGIRITKHLRVHVIPLCEGETPLANEQHLASILEETKRILYDRAQIRVHTTIHEAIRNPPAGALRVGTAAELFIDEAWWKGSWHQLQTVKLFQENLWSLLAFGHPVIVFVVRDVGYDGESTVIGASGGPFTDWVAVECGSVVPEVIVDEAGSPLVPTRAYPPTVVLAESTIRPHAPNVKYSKFVIAHELCHALGLLGHSNSDPADLMWPSTLTGDYLSPFQVGIVRNSAHVTFI